MGGKSDRQTYWIVRRDQLECLSFPVRADIVDHLAGRGAMSVRALAASLGKKPSALYYHVEMLLETGLIEVAGEDTSGRKPETLYQTRAPRMRARRALADPALAEINADMAAATLRQATRDFGHALGSTGGQIEGDARTLGFYRSVGAPDPETLAAINGHLDAIAELMWASRGENEGDLISFAWTMAPLKP